MGRLRGETWTESEKRERERNLKIEREKGEERNNNKKRTKGQEKRESVLEDSRPSDIKERVRGGALIPEWG